MQKIWLERMHAQGFYLSNSCTHSYSNLAIQEGAGKLQLFESSLLIEAHVLQVHAGGSRNDLGDRG
jgi:hypothetical protein